MAVITTNYSVDKNILIAPELAFTIPCIVANTGIVADSDGNKIIKAGTPVGSATNVYENRQTALVNTNSSTDGSKSQGVLLHDVNVTSGNANATLVVAGYVDLLKLDSALTLDAAAKTALTRILFIKGAK